MRGHYTRPSLADRIAVQTLITAACHLWQGGKDDDGYGKITVTVNGNTRYLRTHRAVWELHHGPIPNGLCVCHRCNIPACVRIDHLYLGTSGDNLRDASRDGLLATGDRHGSRTHPERISRGDAHYARTSPERLAHGDRNGARLHPESRPRGNNHHSYLHPECVARGTQVGTARLTPEIVQAIREAAAVGTSHAQISRQFGISTSQAHRIVHRTSWMHI